MTYEPAFPGDRFPGSSNKHGGMSLRDYFAGQAIEGACAEKLPDGIWIRDAAERAYRLADAMMEARKK